MSYANATLSPADRIKAAATVIGVHALLGAGLIAGLAVTTMVLDPPSDETTTVFNVPDDIPPPPPEPTEVPPDAAVPQTPPAAPLPEVDLTRNTPITVVEPTEMPSEVIRVIPVDPPSTGPVAVEPPAPRFTPAPPRPSNAMGSWITANDYSDRDLRRGNEGTARYRLVIGSDGRVDACNVTSSTGHSTLDRATCNLIQRRARFNPATNNQGETVVGTYTGVVTWQIPD